MRLTPFILLAACAAHHEAPPPVPAPVVVIEPRQCLCVDFGAPEVHDLPKGKP